MAGADGFVIIKYKGRVRRLTGGDVTRSDGWIFHAFATPGAHTIKRRWWASRTKVDFLVRGGGGGAAMDQPGQGGQQAEGSMKLPGTATVLVGAGGADGRSPEQLGQPGGPSRLA